jgi:serine phosphatase RsbU (regulator of sigma subunit)
VVAALNIGEALRFAQSSDPASIPDVVRSVAAGLGATDVVMYLVDFAQTTLEPLPDRSTHADVPTSEVVATTMAGRAFVDQVPGSAERAQGVRVWVPILEGSDRTGVLAVTLPSASEETVLSCEELGLFAGYLIATQARCTDVYNLHRRRRSLSLGASMQWDLLPPLVLKTDRVSVAGLLEPAYEVAGDCFDYALNGPVLHVALFDPLGHGVVSALLAAMCVGSYRHDRREGHTLEQIHAHLDAAMATYFEEAFTTGQLAQIDVDSGDMTWTNAGHPAPMLIRGGQVIREMHCHATMPWGIGSLGVRSVAAASERLEPGDSVLFYTDGVVEGRLPGGEPFGAARLADLAGQYASDQLEPEEIVRRLVRGILEKQDERIRDDATLVLVQWHGPR